MSAACISHTDYVQTTLYNQSRLQSHLEQDRNHKVHERGAEGSWSPGGSQREGEGMELEAGEESCSRSGALVDLGSLADLPRTLEGEVIRDKTYWVHNSMITRKVTVFI